VATNASILIVAADARLVHELQQAIGSMAEGRPHVHAVGDHRQAIEAIRGRHPQLVLVEWNTDFRALKTFAQEAAVAAPDTTLAAVFSPELLEGDVSESAVMIEAIRAGVRDFLRRPLSSAEVEQLLTRIAKPRGAPLAKLGRIVSFISNKGGVGKSTLSVNTACGLAKKHPGRVLLIDASLQMGVCSTMLNLKPEATLTDAARERHRLDETLLRQLTVPHESGLHLLASPADAVEAAKVDDEAMTRVLTLARRVYDYVIVDCFPLLDRVIMAILDLSDRVYIVLESVVPTILGAVRLVEVLDKLGYSRERQHLILNRHSSFVGNLKAIDVEDRLKRRVAHIVPYEKRLVVAMNIGRPYILDGGGWFSRCPKALGNIVAEVAGLEPVPIAARGPAPEARDTLNGIAQEIRR